MDQLLGLYLHIPFCKHKCDYCDFYSLENGTLWQRYIDALLLHMEDYAPCVQDYTVDTVFLGGGTPSLLPPKMIFDLIDGIYANFRVGRNAEFTMEANPATVHAATLKKYRKAGINRLSIGVQSLQDRELQALSRIHSPQQAMEAVEDARKAGFDNINLDLMYGIPEQTSESLAYTLETVMKSLAPEHISLYGLKLEEGTPLAARAKTLVLPDEDTECDMYFSSIERLASYDYHQYEISNFAKDGYVCHHNLKYWNCNEYLGLGPGAHSYLGGCRFSFKRDIAGYIDAMEDLQSKNQILDEQYDIDASERLGEYVMLHLRMTSGINCEDFAQRFGRNFEQLYAKYLRAYVAGGYMTKNGSSYALTPKGMYVSNYILSAMLDFHSEMIDGVLQGSNC